MSRSTFLFRRFYKLSLILPGALVLAFLCISPARADWPDNNTNVAKWIEWPDRSVNGFDVLAGQEPSNPAGGSPALILADDFQCTMIGPITDIHIWTSWISLNGSTNIPAIPITLGFWTDVPATNNPTTGQTVPSHPGSLLWTQTLTPGIGVGHYTARPWTGAKEQFWDPDPAPSGTILGPDNLIWQYNFYPSNPFVQQGSPNSPVVYWLSMTTGNNTSSTTSGALMGWKTSTNQLLDNAVFGHLDAAGNPLSDWKELISPVSGNQRSLDLSFVLTTPEVITNPPPPPNKWLQPPNLLNGYDVDATAPFVAADDFLCTNASTITNIQVWGSWKGDVVGSNTTFVVSIWSDVPSTVPGGFSHPGALEWSEKFPPGTYTAGFYTNGQEQFLIPPNGLSPESAVYLYSFIPQNPFCQQGSTQSPMVYWLSVYAINTSAVGATATFGWKTTPSSNHWRDDAVYGAVDSFGNMGGWKELFAPLGAAPVSLDLAFLLNNGPPNPDCDRTVGTKWLQPPDRSTNGLDVFDTYPEVLGDDFICHAPGPITGVSVWGSWLNDIADTNATFQLGLWTDVPKITTNGATAPSHPGQELCSTTFYPPQAVGTSLQRYQYFPAIPNVHETFYKPDIAGTAGFIGSDTIIWRYDFYPFQTAGDCWVQRGSPLGPGLTYWITLTCTTTPNGSTSLFGWKTS
ncbi:MAG TPA: hypothetical protein VFB72_17760, partial [Verrucomicrobiae bacterium]|nr:hypothetical protein [Verrucomicrobiae bacterium]